MRACQAGRMPTSAPPPGPAGPAELTGPDPVSSMTRLVKGAKGRLTGSVTRHLQGAGFGFLRVAHTQVFENLDADGTRLTVLADRAGMTHQAMGELVAELVAAGQLEKVDDPSDRRAKLIRPTAAGRTLLAQGRQHLSQLRARWEDSLDGITVDQVLAALDVLAGLCAEDQEPAP